MMTEYGFLQRRRLYSHVREWEHGEILLHYLSRLFLRFDASGWAEQIRLGNVTVNDQCVPAEQTLSRHDCVAYFLPEDTPEPGADLHYGVVLEDPDFLVLEKPADLCVHPTGPFFRHTLWHLAGRKYGVLRFVNRLDRETSGLILAARNAETAAKLTSRHEHIRKEYLALVSGHFQGSFTARGYLMPDPESRISKKKVFRPDPAAVPGTPGFAETFLSEEQFLSPDRTLVRAILHTGRRHQIRSTLFSLGFPLIGDKLYGPDERLYEKIRTCSLTQEDRHLLQLDRQALHAAVLEFDHPRTGKRIRCESVPPFIQSQGEQK